VQKNKEWSGHLPVLTLDFHLFPPSPFLFPLIFFHFKNIQLCLGDEQNEMSLTYKKRDRRKDTHHITHKFFEIKASF
jgi:hypothetical protein